MKQTYECLYCHKQFKAIDPILTPVKQILPGCCPECNEQKRKELENK